VKGICCIVVVVAVVFCGVGRTTHSLFPHGREYTHFFSSHFLHFHWIPIRVDFNNANNKNNENDDDDSANERTFLAWMHISILLAGASIAILAFSGKSENPVSQLYGVIMLPVAVAFIVYSMYQCESLLLLLSVLSVYLCVRALIHPCHRDAVRTMMIFGCHVDLVIFSHTTFWGISR